jgi:hypothetical protein
MRITSGCPLKQVCGMSDVNVLGVWDVENVEGLRMEIAVVTVGSYPHHCTRYILRFPFFLEVSLCPRMALTSYSSEVIRFLVMGN